MNGDIEQKPLPRRLCSEIQLFDLCELEKCSFKDGKFCTEPTLLRKFEAISDDGDDDDRRPAQRTGAAGDDDDEEWVDSGEDGEEEDDSDYSVFDDEDGEEREVW